jgi:hypothetical protein
MTTMTVDLEMSTTDHHDDRDRSCVAKGGSSRSLFVMVTMIMRCHQGARLQEQNARIEQVEHKNRGLRAQAACGH